MSIEYAPVSASSEGTGHLRVVHHFCCVSVGHFTCTINEGVILDR